jgi:signal peptidase I
MNDEQMGTGVAEPPVETDEVNRVVSSPDGKVKMHSADADKKKGLPRGVVREYFESLVVTAIMALFGMTFIVQAVKVPTGSMQNTILIGDHLLVNKFIFAPGPHVFFLPQREIRRGDIIVFKYPGKFPSPQFRDNPEVDDTREDNQPFKTNYVKRVVGLPGDRIEGRDGQIFINDEPLSEHRVTAVNPGEGRHKDDPLNHAPLRLMNNPAPSGEGSYSVYYKPETVKASEGTFHGQAFEVPADHYFVMGDNRDNSLDSRFWGYVHRDLVVGRAMLVYWSYDESAASTGNFLMDFFTNTRWNRTGTVVK